MADSPTVSTTRYALSLRIAQHVHDHTSTVEALVETTNALQPLFANYEAAVRAEAVRDVRLDVCRSLTDQIDALLAETSDPLRVGYLDSLRRWAQREQVRASSMTRLGAAK